MSSEKRIRTLYNPSVGCQYLIKNLETNDIVKASTLTVRDSDQKPWRSPKGTPPGQEFFKVKMGRKQTGFTYIKFINSSLYEKCISDDGKWEFLAQTPDGKILPKLFTCEKVGKKVSQPKVSAKPKIIKKQEKKEVKQTSVEIREDIFDNEFVDIDSLNDILGKW